MSFAKKLKRKNEVKTKKVINTTQAAIKKAATIGKRLADINYERVYAFCEAKVILAASYIMVEQFGWTYSNMIKMSEGFEHMRALFVDGQKDGKVYITIEWLWEGMEDECNFEFAPYKRLTEPKEPTNHKSWMELYVKNDSISILEATETVWLWVLHDTFGFSGKRLLRFHELLVKFNPLEAPMRWIRIAIERCKKLKSRKRNEDGTYNIVSFPKYEKDFERLDVMGDDFANGLIMATNRVSRRNDRYAY